MNSDVIFSSVEGPVLQECLNLVQDFEKVIFQHCNRESNYVAHELALIGRVNPAGLWRENPQVMRKFKPAPELTCSCYFRRK